MAEQPANALIGIYRTVRTRHQMGRNITIKEMCQRIATKQVMVPSEEINVFLAEDDSFRSDAWRYGHPVSVETRLPLTVGALYTADATVEAQHPHSLAFPVKLVGAGQDLFISKNATHLSDDLFDQVQDAAPAPRGLFEIV